MIKERNRPFNERTWTAMGNNTYWAANGHGLGSIVIFPKVAIPEHPETVATQAEAYRILGKYLQVPRTRKFTDRKGNNMLVVKRLDRIDPDRLSFEQLLLSKSNEYPMVFKQLCSDIKKMWMENRKPLVDEDNLVINRRKNSIDNIDIFLTNPLLQSVIDLPMIVNGMEYPSLRDTGEKCLKNLRERKDPKVVLSHGDEHMRNIMAVREGAKLKYYIFDPREATEYTPASIINTVAGYPLLFIFSYVHKSKVQQGKLNINYELPSINIWNAFSESVNLLVDVMNEVNDGQPSLLKEYLFANLIRGSIKRVDPKHYLHTGINQYAHLAMATQIYYEFDEFFKPEVKQ